MKREKFFYCLAFQFNRIAIISRDWTLKQIYLSTTVDIYLQ